MDGALRRSTRRAEREARDASARAYGEVLRHASGLPIVPLSRLMTEDGWRNPVPEALRVEGAVLVELGADSADSLGECLVASRLLCTTPVAADSKRVVEHRGEPGLPARLSAKARTASSLLTGVGRRVLGLLSDRRLAATDLADHEAVVGDLRFMMDAEPLPSGALSSSPLTFLAYGAGSEAEAHTDRGLLTLIYSHAPGLQIWSRRQRAWLAAPAEPNLLVILVGECAQLATGNSLLASRHRVQPCEQPRRSLALRLRGRPDAPLPLCYGSFWRCANVAEFERMFEASRRSVNAGAGMALPAAAPPPPAPVVCTRVLRPRPARATPKTARSAPARPPPTPPRRSPAEAVFEASDLCELIVAAATRPMLAGGWLEAKPNGQALKALESVCAPLRAAVAPYWRLLCLSQPRCGSSPFIPVDDARQWRARYHYYSLPLSLSITDSENNRIFFKMSPVVPFGRMFDAYLQRQGLQKGTVRFLFDGRRLQDTETPQQLDMEHRDSLDAMMEQVGD